MKTAVIYARYSSDNQTEQSIEGQLRVCEQYAKNNDILIVHTYIDRAMTGTNDNRPDFQQMIRDSNNRQFENIIVYKIDRFSRNKYETAKYKKILKDNGVKLLSAMEKIPDTPEGIILESLLEGMAEYYSAELAQKVSRGMRETRIKGFFQGGALPYGYKLDGRKIVIDESKLEIVKTIFKQYANGVFVKDIVSYLSNNGITNRGKEFKRSTVYDMLRNEAYIGIYRKDNTIYENMYPQIIDNETFSKSLAKRGVNHYGKRSVKSIYLLRNKLICGYCGKKLIAESAITKAGHRINYYKCGSRKISKGTCQKETLRQDSFEDFILDSIISELSKPKILDEIIKKLLAIQGKETVECSTLAILKKKKKQTELALDNILQAIEQGVVNRTTNQRMKQLENEIDEIDRNILIEERKTDMILTEKDIRNHFVKALKKEPLLLIDNLIDHIVVYNDKIEITFNTPINQSPDSQGFLFLEKIQNYKKYVQDKTKPNKTILTLISINVSYFI